MSSEFLYEGVKKNVITTLHKLDRFSKDDVLNSLEVGDLILTDALHIAGGPFNSGVKFLLKQSINKFLQRSIFTSIKMYTDDDKISGYGVAPTHPHDVKTRNASDFIHLQDKILILRPKTNDLIKNIASVYMMKKGKSLTYNSNDVLKSAWKRYSPVFKLRFGISDEEIELNRGSYICSSIIGIAYYRAGFKIKFKNNINLLEAWPVDYIFSKNFEKVGYYKR